jgi:hypothetical protein
LNDIGTSLNQYLITASLGAGGMGAVFFARDDAPQSRGGGEGDSRASDLSASSA